MEASEGQEMAEPAGKTRRGAKFWWALLPVVGMCTLASCLALGGLAVWGIRASKTQEIAAVPARATAPAAQTGTTASPTARPEPTSSPPSSTATAAPSLTPIASPPVQTGRPTPATCDDGDVTYSPTITTPIVSAISFSTAQDPAGWPLDTALQFTTAVTRLQASFAYAGLRDGLAWERVWYFGDQAMSRGQGTWDAGAQGELTVHAVAGEDGFAPGAYRLEISVAGELLGQGAFFIVPEGTSTRLPVQVAYTTWDGARHQINLLDLTTNETRPLLEFGRGPAWSPDNKGLLFYAEEGFAAGEAGLWIHNLDLNQSFPLNEERFFQSIAWSPGRIYVASSLTAEAGSRVVLWDLFENEAFPGPSGEAPAWSPEGRRLAYRNCDEEGWHLSTIHVIGPIFDVDSIRHLTDGDDDQPAWSPDGQRLAFVRREGDNQDIYTVAPDGSNLTRLTDQPGIDTSPAWTPDQRLLFRSRRDGVWGLYVMNADGTNQRRLLVTSAKLDWRPDRLAVSSDVRLIEPTPPQPPRPRVHIPPGQGVLMVSNEKNNDEMTFTIDNQEHKIPPFQIKTIPLRPGHYTWTASWPGKTSRSGLADVAVGQISYPIVER